jgi:small ligand-binding sensory domain FIST
VRILPFVLDQDDLQQLVQPADWHDRVGVPPDAEPGIVILPDPFSIDVAACLDRLDDAFPGSSIVGGMASGGMSAGQNRLFLNDQVLRQGMVGVSLSGPIRVRAVTSQGCRPVGSTFVVTRADSNVIYEGGGKPIMAVVQRMYDEASHEERALLQNGLHVGVVVDEHLATFGAGDFLVRNVMGIVDDKGLAVTDIVRPGQTVQFHVRDARTADEEMAALLRREVETCGHGPAGGLLFTCNGRGTRLFQQPNHDVALVNRLMDDCRVAGFFAQGEIGPISRRTFIHGFTSTLILFYEG